MMADKRITFAICYFSASTLNSLLIILVATGYPKRNNRRDETGRKSKVSDKQTGRRT